MDRKTIAVVGATGNVGSAVKRRLEEGKHAVRSVARSKKVSVDDAAALVKAFRGADAVFLIIPPDPKAADLRKRGNELGEKLAHAVKEAGVRRVVFLSSLDANLANGTGPILALHDMEQRLDALDVPEMVYLRPAYFMENHLARVGDIMRRGVCSAAISPDVAFPMIATADIGEKAAELLTEAPFTEPRVRELLGPRDYTMRETARILGAAVGKTDLRYAQRPYEEERQALLGLGFSESYADALVELSRHLNESQAFGTEPRSAINTTATTLEKFAEIVFRPTFEKAAGAVR